MWDGIRKTLAFQYMAFVWLLVDVFRLNPLHIPIHCYCVQCFTHSPIVPGHGPLTRHIKLWVTLAPGMPRTFFSSQRVSDPDMHHEKCVMHMPWCMLGSLLSVSFKVDGRENSTYLVKGPWSCHRIPIDDTSIDIYGVWLCDIIHP